MVLSDFFKKLFGQKLAKETVSLQDLQNWVNERIDKVIKNKQDADKQVFEEFNSTVATIHKKLVELEHEQLRNEQIQEKAKNYMKGNRESYINLTRIFLSQIPDFTINFQQEFQKQLGEFSEKTRRNFAVLTEFFKDNMVDIAKDLKKLDELSERLTYDNEKLMIAEDLKKELTNLVNFETVINTLQKKVEELDKKTTKANDYINESESKIAELKAGEEYILLLRLGELIKEEGVKLNKLEYDILELFTNLRKPLKKFLYITMSDKKLIEHYVEDPVEAVMKDIKFTIIDVLYRMEKGMTREDPKETEKIRVQVLLVTKDRLEGFVKDIKKIKTLIKGAEMDIEKIEVVAKISKIEAEIVKVHDRHKELDYEKTAIEAEIESLDEDKIRSHVKKHVKDLLKIDLIIEDSNEDGDAENIETNSEEENLQTMKETANSQGEK